MKRFRAIFDSHKPSLAAGHQEAHLVQEQPAPTFFFDCRVQAQHVKSDLVDYSVFEPGRSLEDRLSLISSQLAHGAAQKNCRRMRDLRNPSGDYECEDQEELAV